VTLIMRRRFYSARPGLQPQRGLSPLRSLRANIRDGTARAGPIDQVPCVSVAE